MPGPLNPSLKSEITAGARLTRLFKDAAKVDAANDFDLPTERIGCLRFTQMMKGFLIEVDQRDAVVPTAQRGQIEIVSVASPQDTEGSLGAESLDRRGRLLEQPGKLRTMRSKRHPVVPCYPVAIDV